MFACGTPCHCPLSKHLFVQLSTDSDDEEDEEEEDGVNEDGTPKFVPRPVRAEDRKCVGAVRTYTCFIPDSRPAKSLLDSKYTTLESPKSKNRRLLAALESVMKQVYVGLFRN